MSETVRKPVLYSAVQPSGTLTLTGTKGNRVPVSFSVVCRSNEQVDGELRRWDFSKWSQQTVDNLKADAALGDETGWSDVEYLNKMVAVRTSRPARSRPTASPSPSCRD